MKSKALTDPQLKIVVSILIILLGGISQPLCDDNIRFNHITIEHGLSQSTVYAIVQDQYGFMWFGTRNGLNRYDGYNFNVYLQNPPDPQSLSHNLINCLMEDSVCRTLTMCFHSSLPL